jgi:hypothetical protein
MTSIRVLKIPSMLVKSQNFGEAMPRESMRTKEHAEHAPDWTQIIRRYKSFIISSENL